MTTWRVESSCSTSSTRRDRRGRIWSHRITPRPSPAVPTPPPPRPRRRPPRRVGVGRHFGRGERGGGGERGEGGGGKISAIFFLRGGCHVSSESNRRAWKPNQPANTNRFSSFFFLQIFFSPSSSFRITTTTSKIYQSEIF